MRKTVWLVSTGLLAVLLLFAGWINSDLVLGVTAEQSGLPNAEKVDAQQLRFQNQLAAMKPTGYYVVIDTALNKLYVYRKGELVMEAVCSTGSGLTLVSEKRSWTFETPRGEFTIQSKTSNPVWRKPDWAYLEEGETPPKNASERFEYGVLGEYALGIGDGYFIHGTLYSRLLGQNVTHGCVRVGSKDLVKLAKLVPIGTKVYIF